MWRNLPKNISGLNKMVGKIKAKLPKWRFDDDLPRQTVKQRYRICHECPLNITKESCKKKTLISRHRGEKWSFITLLTLAVRCTGCFFPSQNESNMIWPTNIHVNHVQIGHLDRRFVKDLAKTLTVTTLNSKQTYNAEIKRKQWTMKRLIGRRSLFFGVGLSIHNVNFQACPFPNKDNKVISKVYQPLSLKVFAFFTRILHQFGS